jgi:hypothetical protein
MYRNTNAMLSSDTLRGEPFFWRMPWPTLQSPLHSLNQMLAASHFQLLF